MSGVPRVPMRLVCHLDLAEFPHVLLILLIGMLREPSRVVWRAVLQVCGREVRSRVGESACRHGVLMIAISALPAHATVLLMLIVHMV